MSTQEKVIREIKRIAKRAKLDADFEFSFANVGHVYFRRGFETVANAHLDFQNDHLSVAISQDEQRASYFGFHDAIHLVPYGEANKFRAFFDGLAGALRRIK